MQILDGLEHLHINQIIHRDIKGANIMVDADGVCKLGDFGSAKKIAGLNSDFKSLKGTPNWMAPEVSDFYNEFQVIQQQNYGRAADIWSLGSTIIEMISGKVPWYEYNTQFQAMTKIVEFAHLPKLPSNISPELYDFIKCCQVKDPHQRYTKLLIILDIMYINSKDINFLQE